MVEEFLALCQGELDTGHGLPPEPGKAVRLDGIRPLLDQETAMNPRLWLLPLFVLPLLAAPARAQEGVRDLTGSGQHSKFLTPNQLDRWLFEGEKGETVIAHVASKEFDPILELARTGAKEDKALLEVDDPGSESRFAFRLPEKGKYEIRVHAFKYQGGGNYTLRVQRFQASPLAVGKPLVGTFDREGKGYHYFPGVKDRILVPELKGASSEAWTVLDPKGREAKGWAGTVLVEDDGEGYLIVSGHPDHRYDLLVREARRHDLAEGKDQPGTLQQGEADVWSFQGKPGDFRLLEVEKKGEVQARLVYAPPEGKGEQRLGAARRPAGDRVPAGGQPGRAAAVRGGPGPRRAIPAPTAGRVARLVQADRARPERADRPGQGGRGRPARGRHRVLQLQGRARPTPPGQPRLAEVRPRAPPLRRARDPRGQQRRRRRRAGRPHHAHGRERGGCTGCRSPRLGDGGGGDFRLALKEAKVEELKVGGRGKGTLQPGATDFWAFEGKEGQTVFLSVRSAAFEPAVSLRSPDGVLLAADDKGSAATGSLFALKLPRTGRYTVWVSSRRGAGEYTVRLIDGD